MTIPLSKTIAIIVLVCLVLKGLGIYDIAIGILKTYQKRLDKKEK